MAQRGPSNCGEVTDRMTLRQGCPTKCARHVKEVKLSEPQGVGGGEGRQGVGQQYYYCNINSSTLIVENKDDVGNWVARFQADYVATAKIQSCCDLRICMSLWVYLIPSSLGVSCVLSCLSFVFVSSYHYCLPILPWCSSSLFVNN